MSRSKKKDYPKKFDSRRFDGNCRNHGSCSYCEGNRTHFDKKARARADKDNQANEFFGYWHHPDGSDALESATNKRLEQIGVDPHDWKALVELGILWKPEH